MKTGLFAVFLTAFLISMTTHAQSFDTDPNAILQKLKKQKKTIQLRSIPGSDEQKSVKTRALKRITNDVMGTSKWVEEIVYVQSFDDKDRIQLDIAFDYGKSTINESSKEQLSMLAKVLNNKSVRFLPINVNGHTDSDGDEDYNLKLSYDRATAIKDFLVSEHDIMEARLTISGYGEGDPIAKNNSERGKALNRRVEVSLNY